MNEQIYWFITVMEKLEKTKYGFPETGCTRRWGFYLSKEDALNTLHNNMTDMWETCYDFAILEPYYAGINGYCFEEPRQFFKYDQDKNGYFEIEEPKFIKNIVGYALSY